MYEDLILLAKVKNFINHNKMLERNACNESDKMFFRIMNESIVLSDEFALLTRRLNNAREFIRMQIVDEAKRKNKEWRKKANKIPDDFDERIELYLKNKN